MKHRIPYLHHVLLIVAAVMCGGTMVSAQEETAPPAVSDTPAESAASAAPDGGEPATETQPSAAEPSPPVDPAEPAVLTLDWILSKARAHLGSDEALAAVRTAHFYGVMVLPDGNVGKIEMLVTRDLNQRRLINVGNETEVITAGVLDAWRARVSLDSNEPTRARFLQPEQYHVLRAAAWQNIGFYTNLERDNITAEVLDTVEVDGERCVRVRFNHGTFTTVTKTFEISTGRLVLTETSIGERITEKGEIIVDGVRFPKQVNTILPNGSTMRVSFTKVVLNEDVPDSVFSLPLVPPMPAAAGTPAE